MFEPPILLSVWWICCRRSCSRCYGIKPLEGIRGGTNLEINKNHETFGPTSDNRNFKFKIWHPKVLMQNLTHRSNFDSKSHFFKKVLTKNRAFLKKPQKCKKNHNVIISMQITIWFFQKKNWKTTWRVAQFFDSKPDVPYRPVQNPSFIIFKVLPYWSFLLPTPITNCCRAETKNTAFKLAITSIT